MAPIAFTTTLSLQDTNAVQEVPNEEKSTLDVLDFNLYIQLSIPESVL